MIDVAAVLRALPRLTRFLSVQDLTTLVDSLRGNPERFEIDSAGTSSNGLPVHHVRSGNGRVKALFMGFPDANEPIGSLTIHALLTLLKEGNRELLDADVEWHIIPCIDPDGALLNEGWSQQGFSFDGYMRNFYRRNLCDQVEASFPIHHKRLVFDRPTREASILRGLLADIRPDFYYTLHNTAGGGGAWYCITRNIGQRYFQQLVELREANQIPLRVGHPFRQWSAEFAEGIGENFSTKRFYDFLERTMPRPEELLPYGAGSWDYLEEIKPAAITFLAELPCIKHPKDGSKKKTEQSKRQILLRLDADIKFVATVILEEWEKVQRDLDPTSPFYANTFNGVISTKETLHEGLPSTAYKTRDLLFNQEYSRAVTEGEQIDLALYGYFLLCQLYSFVRLLKASTQTQAVREATERAESVFEGALRDIAKSIDFDAFEVIDHATLARVQFGSGLIVLNAVSEAGDAG